jgi:hypothetical protein
MLRNSLFVILLATFVLAAVSCTVTPDTYPVAKVNNKVITLKQVEDHPQFKGIVDEFILKQLITDTAAAKGIKITDEKVTQEYEKMRKDFGGDKQWADFLAGQGMSESDVKDQIKARLVFFELLKAGENVTDADAKAEFDANPDYYRGMYAKEKNLTVDESANLKFEDMKDYLIDQMKLNRAYPKAQKMMQDLKDKASVEYLYMTPEKRAETKKHDEEARKKQEEDAKKLQPQAPPAENGSGQAGKLAEGGKPADGAKAGQPPAQGSADKGKGTAPKGGGDKKTGK